MQGNNFVETIHIELSDEGGHVGVFVVVGQDCAGELRLVSDPEGAPVLAPADVLVGVPGVHHPPELGQEGGDVGGSLRYYQLYQRHSDSEITMYYESESIEMVEMLLITGCIFTCIHVSSEKLISLTMSLALFYPTETIHFSTN